VAAEHYDDRASVVLRGCNRAHDAEKITRYQNVGKRLEERGEAAILARRRGKFGGGYLVRPLLDWNCPNLR
jgi:hypothetical protein